MLRTGATILCFCLLVIGCGEDNNAGRGHQLRTLPLPRVTAAPGAGVAWFAGGPGMKGITPDGKELSVEGSAFLNGSNSSNGLRSADGGRLFLEASGKLKVANTSDGQVVRSIDLPTSWGPVSGGHVASVSVEGRWLGMASEATNTKLLLVDLERGEVVASGSVTHNARARTSAPSLSGLLAAPGGRLLVMPPADGELISMADHSGRLEVEARFSDSKLLCNSAEPPLLHLVPDGTTLVGFCPFDGVIWWFDLARFQLAERMNHGIMIGNPFWGAPVVSPDGGLLYVYDSWGGVINVVDVVQRRVLRSEHPVRSQAEWRLPFVIDAYAKGPNRAAALTPDGGTLLTTGTRGPTDGLYAVDAKSLTIKAHWLSDRKVQSIWAGGDGQAIYVLEERMAILDILNPATGSVQSLTLPGLGDFSVP